MRKSSSKIGIIFLLLLVVIPSRLGARSAQLSALPDSTAQTTATKSPASSSSDFLGRTTPRGTVIGFIQAAQDENYSAAIQYFQPSTARRHPAREEEQELAQKLLAILDARFAGSLDSISRDAQGRLDDGLPPEQEQIGGIHGLSESFPLLLVRMEDPVGTKIWYVSRQTLDQVPKAYDSLRFPQIEKQIPEFLVKNRPLSVPLWQWAAIILFAPVALFLGWVIALLARRGVEFLRRTRRLPPLPPMQRRHIGPGTLLTAAIIHYYFVSFIGTSVLYRQYYERIIWIFLAFACYWALTNVTRYLSESIWNSLTTRNRLAERSLISLTRHFLDVALFLIIGLWVLRYSFNFNVNAALAGLGIGGLAIGLGAQKTFENLLGGISILTDRALLVGDSCKIGDRAGIVEDIGLRSTKLRTEDRTVVSIPNGTVATSVLENFRYRDKILFRQLLRLRYDLSPDHVRYVLTEVREVLAHHSKVDSFSARVRVLRFAEYAIEVEIFAYVLERDWDKFLNVQEELILKILDTLERTGAPVALSSQNTVVTQDTWINPEKAAAAKNAIASQQNSPPSGSQTFSEKK